MAAPRITTQHATARMREKTKPTRRIGIVVLVGIFIVVLLAVYIFLISKLMAHQIPDSGVPVVSPASAAVQNVDKAVRVDENHVSWSNSPRHSYKDWKQLAVELAALPPDEILKILKTQDPFGVRKFEEKLLQMESDRQAILQLDDIQQLFPCPKGERITLPDQRNHELAKKYRQGLDQLKQPKEDFVFLFFQHLRKAGGTNFCGLAERNLLQAQVPQYYCMPDYHWIEARKCAGCLTGYENEDIANRMVEAGHRILGNEWDNFAPRFFDLPAVFATSFRRPLDRALSQFRFECIEDRGCKIKEVGLWWQKRRDLTNVYIWTFAKMPTRHISTGTTKEDAKRRQEAMGKALDTVAKFNLVLAMEWLAYAPEHTRDVLGFKDTSTMTERIRPHINWATRKDGQEHNQLGAAGIAKASWTPENYLSKEQYKIMSEDLALDEVLTDAARRMFLERVVCEDMSENNFLTS